MAGGPILENVTSLRSVTSEIVVHAVEAPLRTAPHVVEPNHVLVAQLGIVCQDVTDRREVTFSKMGPPALFLHGDEYRVHGHHGLSAQLLQAFPLHP